MPDERERPRSRRDERIVIPLDLETALRGLLQVDPRSAPVDEEPEPEPEPPKPA